MNVLATQAAPGATPLPPLTWWAVASQTWKSEHLLDFLRHTLPSGDGLPRVMVLDNQTWVSGCGICRSTARS